MNIFKMIFSRIVIFGLILVIQVVWLVDVLLNLQSYSTVASSILTVLSLLVTLYIVYKDGNPAYKLAWIVPILVFPVFGGLLYLAMGNKKPPKKYRRAIKQLKADPQLAMPQNEGVMEKIKEASLSTYGQTNYISKVAGYPIYKNEYSKYYPIGEEYYEDLIVELKKAKHFIFMEYFIVEEGEMFDRILEILYLKAKEGVDVRFMYDDVGSVSILPYGYAKRLERKGIKCIAFNPFVPFLSVAMNNRDHRKITVIDGHTAFTGGINLADEYINAKVRFGHWKDTGIRVRGQAVWNFTVMFLRMWNINRITDTEFAKFGPEVYRHEMKLEKDEEPDYGYIQPYGDSPTDDEITGENVYLNIINMAVRYVYIFTPYLIVDHEMITAITLAAKRGVDVRIVTPGIADKKIVNEVTKSYYPILLQAGAKIYEYTPGFLHAKCVVCDDEIATVGTINMDFRSLYLHFENGVYLYKTKTVADIKADMLHTMNVSESITYEMTEKGRAFGIVRAILRLFAPLM